MYYISVSVSVLRHSVFWVYSLDCIDMSFAKRFANLRSSVELSGDALRNSPRFGAVRDLRKYYEDRMENSSSFVQSFEEEYMVS